MFAIGMVCYFVVHLLQTRKIHLIPFVEERTILKGCSPKRYP